jgi:hypothetical protein
MHDGRHASSRAYHLDLSISAVKESSRPQYRRSTRCAGEQGSHDSYKLSSRSANGCNSEIRVALPYHTSLFFQAPENHHIPTVNRSPRRDGYSAMSYDSVVSRPVTSDLDNRHLSCSHSILSSTANTRLWKTASHLTYHQDADRNSAPRPAVGQDPPMHQQKAYTSPVITHNERVSDTTCTGSGSAGAKVFTQSLLYDVVALNAGGEWTGSSAYSKEDMACKTTHQEDGFNVLVHSKQSSSQRNSHESGPKTTICHSLASKDVNRSGSRSRFRKRGKGNGVFANRKDPSS